MTTWQYMGRLFAWRRREFVLNVLAWSVFHLVPLANGLIVRGIFNALSGNAQAGWNAWTFLAILACSYAFRQGTFLVAFRMFSRYHLTVQAFLRRNLLDHLMMAAGSRVLPESPSEAVSRFRDDVGDVANYAESWIDFSGMVLYGICSMAVLFSVPTVIVDMTGSSHSVRTIVLISSP